MNASLSERQLAFAGHIRDPQQRPRPAEVPERRMAVYRELFFNNVAATLADGLPRVRGCLTEAAWTTLVRRFFADHRSPTPYLHQLPGEFAAWLGATGPHDPPHLAELADLEWGLQALAWAETPPLPAAGPGDLLAGVPVLSPLARLVAYRYPVQRTDDTSPQAVAGGVHLLIWRDAEEAVRLLELNAVSARLVALLAAGEGRSGRALLGQVATELGHPNPAAVVAGGHRLLEDLAAKAVLLGVARP